MAISPFGVFYTADETLMSEIRSGLAVRDFRIPVLLMNLGEASTDRISFPNRIEDACAIFWHFDHLTPIFSTGIASTLS
jgi:hypothetical protein